MKKILLIGFMVFLACSESQDVQTETETGIEKHRPVYHFTPPSAWMNDPNGMFYYEGEYHLFYQHYPDNTVWGPMHWGHAVSTDLVHWEHLPIALYPDELGYIFSGSAVVDWNNTSGLGTDEQPPLIAMYTYHFAEGEARGDIDYQTQGIAYSLDKGRTWTKYKENPVLENPGIKDFRDPNLIWMDSQNKWILTLAVKDHIRFYSSPNLLDWTLESEFGKDLGAHGGVWECPDLFPLQVEGTSESKWVLLVSINPGAPNGGSGTMYFVGDFDGNAFTVDPAFLKPEMYEGKAKWIDYGMDNYAGVTWSDVPEADGRRIFIGWMSNWLYALLVPTESWRSAMTISREFILDKIKGEYLLRSVPVAEYETLVKEHWEVEEVEVLERYTFETDLTRSSTYRLDLDMDLTTSEGFELRLFNKKDEVIIDLDVVENTLSIDRSGSGEVKFHDSFSRVTKAPFESGAKVSVTLFVDVTSVEVFVNEGEVVMTEIFFPKDLLDQLDISSKGGLLQIEKAVVSGF